MQTISNNKIKTVLTSHRGQATNILQQIVLFSEYLLRFLASNNQNITEVPNDELLEIWKMEGKLKLNFVWLLDEVPLEKNLPKLPTTP